MKGKLKEFFREDAADRESIPAIKMEENKIKDVAVIGMAVMMPMADSLKDYWQNILNCASCVRGFPRSRKHDTDNYLYYTGKLHEKIEYCETACLEEIDKFDYEFFGISPNEASLMDPHQRLFLETVWKAIEDAGYSPNRLNGSRTGVYASHVGAMHYKKLIEEFRPSDILLSTSGNIPQMVASRVSYILDLKGPSILVDTACSSSLVAVHLACQAIRNGECEMAVAGGVKINLLPIDHGDRFGVESSDGRTRTFDDNSDGTGMGEGAAAVVLKPLKQALEDRDRIYGVIKGSAVNQDGSSMGITAPNPEAQEDVIIRAWKDAGIDPCTISYIELHGTATKLGDPVEAEGIRRAFGRFSVLHQFCAAGTVKSNIGHLDHAAGIAGLVKCMLALKHGILPPSINFVKPNRKTGLEISPIYINTRAKRWISENSPRRCGISSFGIGGTNCHMVLEEAPACLPAVRKAEDPGILILPLSAKNMHALRQLAKEYRTALDETAGDRIRDFCYSAGTGRGHYRYRLAIVAWNREELISKFDQMLMKADGFDMIDGVYFGSHRVVSGERAVSGDGDLTADRKDEINRSAALAADRWLMSGKTDMEAAGDLCRQYVKGADIDWSGLYREDGLFKTELPGYPFSKERCWVEMPLAINEEQDHADYYYRLAWIKEQSIVNCASSGKLLVFTGEWALCGAIVNEIKERGIEIIEVRYGQVYRKLSSDVYECGNSEDDYERLFGDAGLGNITGILHMSALKNEYRTDTINEFEECLQRGIYNLFRINKALNRYQLKREIELIIIADYACEVTGREPVIKPENSALFGIGKTINIENVNIRLKYIDIDFNTEPSIIAQKIIDTHPWHKVAFRDNIRYSEQFEKLDLTSQDELPVEICSDGVYVITGGTGGLGLEMAGLLSGRNRVNIALISRTRLPDKEVWDEVLRRQDNHRLHDIIRSIRKIESKGSSVTCLQCDVSNEEDTALLLEDLRNMYGRIRGVIHCAGVGVGQFSDKMDVVSEKEFKDGLLAKLYGTWVLQRHTAKDKLDFLAVFTSPITLMGGFGQGGYTCANAYLDSFPYLSAKKGQRAFAVGWGPWEKTAERMGVLFNKDKQLFRTMTAKEITACFEELLMRDVRTVYAGVLNLNSTMFAHNEEDLGLTFSREIREHIGSGGRRNPYMTDDGFEGIELVGRGSGDLSGEKAQVGKIIGKVLGLKKIDIWDNFYELGGDSLHAMKVINLIRRQFNVEVLVSEMMSYPIIKEFADYFYNRYIALGRVNDSLSDIRHVEKREYYPLSSAQKRLFILNQAEGDDTSYNWPIILSMKGSLDIRRLEDAFRGLVDRHESLRTSYCLKNGEPVQIIHEKVPVNISYITSDKEHVRELIRKSIRPYKLEQVPLFRIALIEMGDREYILFFDMHHIISDGMSTDILMYEFMQLYNGAALPPVDIQYRDYACWQAEMLNSDYMKKQERYWLEKLSAFSFTELPKKMAANPGPKEGAEIREYINEALNRAIDGFCTEYKVTKYVFLLTLFNIALYKEIKQETICVGTPVMGRRHSSLEKTVGIFLNVLCLSSRIESKQSFLEYMKSVNSVVLEAWDNQDYPYEELYLKLYEKTRLKSLFSILFNYVPAQHDNVLTLDGLETEKVEFAIEPKYDLTLYIREEAPGLLLHAVYISNYYERFRIQRILDNIIKLAGEVMADPDILIKDVLSGQAGQDMLDISLLDQHFDNEEFMQL